MYSGTFRLVNSGPLLLTIRRLARGPAPTTSRANVCVGDNIENKKTQFITLERDDKSVSCSLRVMILLAFCCTRLLSGVRVILCWVLLKSTVKTKRTVAIIILYIRPYNDLTTTTSLLLYYLSSVSSTMRNGNGLIIIIIIISLMYWVRVFNVSSTL